MNNFLGEIVILPFNFAPAGFAFCNGQMLSISQNPALYSLIGNSFGGSEGKGDFALPDYRGLAPEGSQYFIALEGIYPKKTGDGPQT